MMSNNLSESAHLLNEQCNLSGIVCKSNDQNIATNKPTIVMLNSGFLHHVGPYRMYTDLSRELAAEGYNCLRFDLSNVGDSLVDSNSELDPHEQARNDISQAFNFMQENYQSECFITLGICSGADDSFDIALHDERVCGAIMIDGHGYRTPKYYLYHLLFHYGRRLLSLSKWKTIIKRLVHLTNKKSVPVGMFNELDDGIRIAISQKEIHQHIAHLASRSCKLRFIYTGGVSDYYNYHGQFEDSFPETKSNPLISAHYFPDSDHLFMLKHHRKAAQNSIKQWIMENY